MTAPRFEGRLEAGPGGGAFVVLPADVLAALGGGTRFRVKGELNGVAFSSSTMAMGGGRACLGVHKATRQAAAVDIGAIVTVALERDAAPRELRLPEELVAAFTADPAVASAFEGLSFTRRREYAEWITGAKRADTRTGRVQRTLDELRATR